MYRINKNIIITKIGNKYYISFRNNEDENVIVINESGKMIIKELVESLDMEEFKNNVFNMFGVTERVIENDIMPFVGQLEKHKIIIQNEGHYNERNQEKC